MILSNVFLSLLLLVQSGCMSIKDALSNLFTIQTTAQAQTTHSVDYQDWKIQVDHMNQRVAAFIAQTRLKKQKKPRMIVSKEQKSYNKNDYEEQREKSYERAALQEQWL